MIKQDWSCRTCEERTVGCHGTCERYLSERKKADDQIELSKVHEADQFLMESPRIKKLVKEKALHN